MKTIADTGNPGNRRRGGAVLMVAVVLSLGILAWHSLYWYREVNDDAYVSLRYSRNFALGRGLAYNPGERVEGFSDLLWVLTFAAAGRLGVRDFALASKVIGLAAALATLALTPLLFRRVFPALDPRWAALPPLLLACSPWFVSWAVRGLETPLFAFLLTLNVLLLAARVHTRTGGAVLLGLSLFALSITRPEGIIFVLIPLGDALVARVRHGRHGARDLLVAGIAVGLFLLFLVWRVAAYGELWPNTFFAKTTYGLPFLYKPRGWRYLEAFFLGHDRRFTLLLLLAAAAGAAARRLPPLLWLPPAVVTAYAWYVNGDWMDNFRFFAPVLPFLYLAVAAAPGLVSKALGARRTAAALAATLVLATGAAHAAHGLSLGQESRYSRMEAVSDRKSSASWVRAPWRLVQMGLEPILWEPTRWLLENAGEGTKAALPDIGFIGWATDLPVYDTQGLVNRQVSHLYHLRRLRQASLDRDLVDDFLRVSPAYAFLRRTKAGKDGVNQQEKALLASPRFAEGWKESRVFQFNKVVDLVLFVKEPAPPPPSPATVTARYREAVRWSPRVPHLQIGLYLHLLSLGETEEAEETARRGRERFPLATSFR